MTLPTATYLATNATQLCTVNGYPFYECPVNGDEAPMLAVIDGLVVETPFWDLEDSFEVLDWVNDFKRPEWG